MSSTARSTRNTSSPQDEASTFAALLERLHQGYCRRCLCIRYISLTLLLIGAGLLILTLVHARSLGVGKTILLSLATLLGSLLVAFLTWVISGMRLDTVTTDKLDALCSRFSTHRPAIFADAHRLLAGRPYLGSFLRLIDKDKAEQVEVLSSFTWVDLR